MKNLTTLFAALGLICAVGCAPADTTTTEPATTEPAMEAPATDAAPATPEGEKPADEPAKTPAETPEGGSAVK